MGGASRRYGRALGQSCLTLRNRHNASFSPDRGWANWQSQPYSRMDGGHCSYSIMKTTEGITVQQANELVSGLGAARGQGAIINPIACSFALVAIDLLLIGVFSITCAGFTTTGGFSSDEKGLIFMFAPFIFVLSLWQQGAY